MSRLAERMGEEKENMVQIGHPKEGVHFFYCPESLSIALFLWKESTFAKHFENIFKINCNEHIIFLIQFPRFMWSFNPLD
jgi:hypothetical protein